VLAHALKAVEKKLGPVKFQRSSMGTKSRKEKNATLGPLQAHASPWLRTTYQPDSRERRSAAHAPRMARIPRSCARMPAGALRLAQDAPRAIGQGVGKAPLLSRDENVTNDAELPYIAVYRCQSAGELWALVSG
jgi:hypothetical protein